MPWRLLWRLLSSTDWLKFDTVIWRSVRGSTIPLLSVDLIISPSNPLRTKIRILIDGWAFQVPRTYHSGFCQVFPGIQFRRKVRLVGSLYALPGERLVWAPYHKFQSRIWGFILRVIISHSERQYRHCEVSGTALLNENNWEILLTCSCQWIFIRLQFNRSLQTAQLNQTAHSSKRSTKCRNEHSPEDKVHLNTISNSMPGEFMYLKVMLRFFGQILTFAHHAINTSIWPNG